MHKCKCGESTEKELGLLCRKGSVITINHHINMSQKQEAAAQKEKYNEMYWQECQIRYRS